MLLVIVVELKVGKRQEKKRRRTWWDLWGPTLYNNVENEDRDLLKLCKT